MRAGIYGTEPGRVRAIYATGAIYGSCRVSGGALSLSARDEELRRAFCAGYSPTGYFSYFIYYNRQTCVCQTKKCKKDKQNLRPAETFAARRRPLPIIRPSPSAHHHPPAGVTRAPPLQAAGHRRKSAPHQHAPPPQQTMRGFPPHAAANLCKKTFSCRKARTNARRAARKPGGAPLCLFFYVFRNIRGKSRRRPRPPVYPHKNPFPVNRPPPESRALPKGGRSRRAPPRCRRRSYGSDNRR